MGAMFWLQRIQLLQLMKICWLKLKITILQRAYSQYSQVKEEQEFWLINISCCMSPMTYNSKHQDQLTSWQEMGQIMRNIRGLNNSYQVDIKDLLTPYQNSVFLSNRVRKVSWKGTQSEIVIQNGATYYTRYVIMAVPLGVLKKKVIQFSPPLPSWKKEAIDSLGFGNVCKILIDFPVATFTTSTNHQIGVVGDDVTKRGLAKYFLNLKELANVPALMTFGSGGLRC